jgi:putative tryptophan/tyrosine transport system substrate-binding protein
MRRRDFIALLGELVVGLAASAAWSFPTRAQSQPRAAKLGILSPDFSSSADLASGSELSVFLRAMHESGYVEGRNIRIEFRFAENQLDRLPALALELVAWGPDVIYTYTSGGAQAAANGTKTIPIVVGPAGETVMLALAGNLAHPTGNVTGLSIEGPELYEKCLQLLKELLPSLTRVGVLVNPDNPAWGDYPAVLSPAAVQLGLVLVRAASRGAADIDKTLAELKSENLGALLVVNDSTFGPDGLVGSRIIEFAREQRLPSASPSVYYARHGALLSIGTDQRHLRRRAAEYVHKIIEGARPGDLPIERPTKFVLGINLKTAKAIGIMVPTAILLRADEVIE